MTGDASGPRPIISVSPPVSHAVIDPPKERFYFGQPVIRPPTSRAPARDGSSTDERVAVLVCHGMGQQVPFEHIDAISQAVLRGAPEAVAGAKVRVGYASLGEQRLPRAEIELQVGGKRREVHVYEAYWAPVTEGKVSALDVSRFLFDAGLRGIRYALRGSFAR